MLLKSWIDSILLRLKLATFPLTRPLVRRRRRHFGTLHLGGAGQALEIRTLLTTSISVIGLDLLVEDADGGDTDDRLTIRTSGTNVEISDPSNTLNTIVSGATGSGTNTVTVPLSAFSGDLRIQTRDGNDEITLDGFLPDSNVGVEIDGQAGFDAVFIQGLGAATNGGNVSIAADQIEQSANLTTDGGDVTYSANNGVTLSGAAADVDTGGGTFAVDADSDDDGLGSFHQADVGSVIRTAGGDLQIVAANVDFSGQLDAGTGNVQFQTSRTGETILLSQSSSSSIDTELFFADFVTQKIQRADLDGSNVADLLTGLATPRDVVLDYTNDKLYWTSSGTRTIRRSNVDGSGAEVIVDLGPTASPVGIAFDITNQHVYWTNRGNGSIQRANADGSGLQDVVTGLDAPVDVAVDALSNKVYFSDENTGEIQRANLDGSNIEVLIVGVNSKGIALDVPAGKLYFTEDSQNKVQRANLDGSGVEDLVTTGISGPTGIALDPLLNVMYWTDVTNRQVVRASMSGGVAEPLIIGTFANGITAPNGITVTPTAVPTYSFSPTELNNITADFLKIGDATTGTVSIVGDVSPANIATLDLRSGTSIDSDDANHTLTVPTLHLTAGDSIGATNELSLNTDSLAVQMTATGDVRLAETNATVVSSIDVVGGTLQLLGGEFQLSADNVIEDSTVVELADVPGVRLNLNGHDVTIAALAGGGLNGGQVTLGSATLTVNSTGDSSFDGEISGSGGLTKSGVGSLTLSGNQTFSGATTLSNGTLVIDGSLDAASVVNVQSNATLMGTGEIPGGVVIRAGGSLDSALNIGQLSLDTGASIRVAQDGNTPGSGFAQTMITAGIDLDANLSGGATLEVLLNSIPSAGDAFVIIDNEGGLSVGGNFAGLPEGSTLLIGSVPLEVSYIGGNGNDVSLRLDTTPVINAGDVNNIVVRLNADNLEVVDTDTSKVLMAAPVAVLSSLTINGQNGDDTIRVESLGSAFAGDLILNGGADQDQFSFDGQTDFGVGSLVLNAETIDFASAIAATELNVTGENVSQTEPIHVAATATFNVGEHDLFLENVANDFDVVVVTSAGDVMLDDANGISLGDATVVGNLHVDSAGGVNVVGGVHVGGMLSIDSLANGGSGADIFDAGSGYLSAPASVSLNTGSGSVLVDHPNTWLGPSDFGDADAPYPTRWADTGANHPVDAAFHLGAAVDPDSDGQPSPNADGDDVDLTDTLAIGDDEDGVQFLSVLVRADNADTQFGAIVNAQLDGRDGFLNAWIDFNGDGNWNGAREQVVSGLQLQEGENFVAIVVPQGVDSVAGQLAARFRLSEWQVVNPDGFAQTG